MVDQFDHPLAFDIGLLRQVRFRVEHVGQLQQVAPTRSQRSGNHLEGATVLLLGLEVADRSVVEVEDEIELRLEGHLPQIGFPEVDIADREPLGIASGDLEKVRGDVDAKHREAAPRQLDRVPAGSTGEIEHASAWLGSHHRQDAVDFSLGLIGPGTIDGRLSRKCRPVPVGLHLGCAGRLH
jgi:hypothetical protein